MQWLNATRTVKKPNIGPAFPKPAVDPGGEEFFNILLMDLAENKNNWKAQAALEDRLMRIHIRRAKLLGLDAPTKLDVSGLYQRGGADIEAEQRVREAVIEALPIEEPYLRTLLPSRSAGQSRRPLATRHRNDGE